MFSAGYSGFLACTHQSEKRFHLACGYSGLPIVKKCVGARRMAHADEMRLYARQRSGPNIPRPGRESPLVAGM